MTPNFPPLNESDYQIDLMSDLGQMCSEELLAMGYDNITLTDPKELCERYLNALYRRVSVRKRTFHQSNNLQIPPEVQGGFDLLKMKVENGDDLTAHLSGLLDKIEQDQKKAHLIERTGPILMAMVHDDDFYAIAIVPHGKSGSPDVFYDLDLIEILHQSFPKMMEHYRVNGRAAQPKPTNSEVKMLRDAGVTIIPQTNDGTLFMPNLGFTSAGGTTKNTGARVVFDAMKVVKGVKTLEKQIREKIVPLELCFSKTGGVRPYKIVLTGFLNNGYVTAREESSYVGMRISLFEGPTWLDMWHEKRP